MSTESDLREKLQKIEALFAGAKTPGERIAAEAALQRVHTRLADARRDSPRSEPRGVSADSILTHLLVGLYRRVHPGALIGGLAAMIGWSMLTGDTSWTGNTVVFLIGTIGTRRYIRRVFAPW
ncbi:hypothetical protein [Rhodoplanes sp. SY1]|uniref:hypothetical protein n=1 Tax=Rhodoplanes sp. SY1 TaxID=3166646 RepID=UPI0038B54ED1